MAFTDRHGEPVHAVASTSSGGLAPGTMLPPLPLHPTPKFPYSPNAQAWLASSSAIGKIGTGAGLGLKPGDPWAAFSAGLGSTGSGSRRASPSQPASPSSRLTGSAGSNRSADLPAGTGGAPVAASRGGGGRRISGCGPASPDAAASGHAAARSLSQRGRGPPPSPPPPPPPRSTGKGDGPSDAPDGQPQPPSPAAEAAPEHASPQDQPPWDPDQSQQQSQHTNPYTQILAQAGVLGPAGAGGSGGLAAAAQEAAAVQQAALRRRVQRDIRWLLAGNRAYQRHMKGPAAVSAEALTALAQPRQRPGSRPELLAPNLPDPVDWARWKTDQLVISRLAEERRQGELAGERARQGEQLEAFRQRKAEAKAARAEAQARSAAEESSYRANMSVYLNHKGPLDLDDFRQRREEQRERLALMRGRLQLQQL